MADGAALERALADALAGSGPLPAPALPAPGAEVVIVLAPDPDLALALAPLLDRLAMGGVHRGRLELVLAAPDGTPATPQLAGALRERLGVRVHVHDPAHAQTFPLRLADGVVVAVDDALRECEALVLAGRLAPGDGAGNLSALLTPGLGDPATRAACRTPRADGRSWGAWTADALGVEITVAFASPDGVARAWVGDPARVAAALPRAS